MLRNLIVPAALAIAMALVATTGAQAELHRHMHHVHHMHHMRHMHHMHHVHHMHHMHKM